TLDFSQMNAGGAEDALAESFFQAVKSDVRLFLARHAERVPRLGAFEGELRDYRDATSLVSNLLAAVAGAGHELYVLIDQYDNFANRLLAEGAQATYEALVARTSFVRSFYGTLKAGTRSGAVGRMFITGVTPLLLDDLASGFNIVTSITTSHRFNALAGFT